MKGVEVDLAYNYTPNNWSKYDDSKPLNEQLETIISKNKLDHMEEGIKSANIEHRIGEIKLDATRLTPTAQYRVDKVNGIEYLDITIPGTAGAAGQDGGVADKVSHALKFTGSTILSYDGSADTTVYLVGSSSNGTGEIFNDYTNNKATGNYSHAEGIGTLASSAYQHVEGKYNVEDTTGKYLHILGGGTSNTNRKNIHTVDTSGNAYYAGNVEIGGTPTSSNHLINKNYVDSSINTINNNINTIKSDVNNLKNDVTTVCSEEDLLVELKKVWS